MEVVSLSSLPVGSVVWQPRQGAWMLSFVCKITFRLLPGRAALAEEYEPLYPADRHWSDDPGWSVYAPSDVAPVRPRADVVLVGEAYAPGGSPARSLVARLRVSEIDKRVEVCGERYLGPDGKLVEGARFTRMPLLWERAAGGPDTVNPVGIRPDVKDGYGRRALPNLLPPGFALMGMDDAIEPAGFGPIAASWPERRQKLGRAAGSFSEREWTQKPLPPGVDVGYFNAAPWDQQADRIRDDERLVLEHLHPDHPHLATQLPGHHPRAFVTRPGRAAYAAQMQVDLLWIRTDRGICTLTWRGQVPLERVDEEGKVVVALEEPGQTISWEDISGGPVGRPPMGTLPDVDEGEEESPITLSPYSGTMPPQEATEFQRAMAMGTRPATGADTALPFAPPPVIAQPPPPVIALPPPVVAQPPPVIPSAPPSTPPAFGAAPGSAPALTPPPLVRPQSAPRTIGESVVGAPATSRPGEGTGTSGGALTASNAAAAASVPWSLPREAPVSGVTPIPGSVSQGVTETKPIVQILWFDPESAPRFRRQPAWQKILEELDKKPLDKEHEDPALAKEPGEIEDRREVFEVLVRGSADDAEGMEDALVGAIRSDGKLVPPLRILAGELIFPFDETEALKATVAAVTPFVGQDENLRASVAAAQDFLKVPDLRSAPAVAEGLAARIAEAWAQGKRPTPANYLETQTERALLEGRCYQRRKLLGGKQLRALAQTAGSQPLLPAYLPDELADKLPVYQRFKARAIVEVHPQVDQYEAQPLCLRVLALARVAPAMRRG
ncbi:MAG TPA: DUF2169 domain-containing protein [Candidatus Nanopelagicales bacterium]|nr:DUF2169 domain-containing protein [Candidatus Nanopelagicales bacterium]